MDIDLRLILLGVGLVLIASILFDAFKRRKKVQEQVREFEETVLSTPSESDGTSLFVDEDDPLLEVSAPRKMHPSETPAPVQLPPQIITVTLMPRMNQISGRKLNAAFQANQLKFGDKRIFHKHRGDKMDGDILFSVASMTEPGWFEPSRVTTNQFKGLVVFMDANAIHDPLSVFEKMLAASRHMANAIDAQLCDESRHPLSPQVIEHLKEQIKENQRKLLAKENID